MTYLWLLSLKNDVNVPSKSSKQKNNTSYARTTFNGNDFGPYGNYLPRYPLNPDPDPGFFVETDPDPVLHPDPAFNNKKKSEVRIFLILKQTCKISFFQNTNIFQSFKRSLRSSANFLNFSLPKSGFPIFPKIKKSITQQWATVTAYIYCKLMWGERIPLYDPLILSPSLPMLTSVSPLGKSIKWDSLSL